jgi:hypothetical protein
MFEIVKFRKEGASAISRWEEVVQSHHGKGCKWDEHLVHGHVLARKWGVSLLCKSGRGRSTHREARPDQDYPPHLGQVVIPSLQLALYAASHSSDLLRNPGGALSSPY